MTKSGRPAGRDHLQPSREASGMSVAKAALRVAGSSIGALLALSTMFISAGETGPALVVIGASVILIGGTLILTAVSLLRRP